MPNRVVYTFVVSDQFSRAARSISKRTREVTRDLKVVKRTARVASRGVVGAFASMKTAALGFQSSMAPMIAGFVGIAGAVKAFTVGAGFQDALADLSSITGSTGKELVFLRNESLRLGKAAKVGAAATAEAFKVVASAKSELLEDPAALSKVTEQVLLLKNATGLDLLSATEAVVESLNQFNAGADETARFVNVLAAGAKVGASEVRDTAAAIVQVGPVARRAGLDFEQVNSAIQVLAKGGIKGSMAGRQLKGVLLSLESSANKRLRPSLVGINSALQSLQDLQLDNVQLTKLFGRENVAVGSILAEQAALVGKWGNELRGTNVAQDQANARLNTMSAKMRGLGVTISNKVIGVFDRLAPQFEEMADGFGKFLDSITAEDLDSITAGLQNMLGVVNSLASAAVALGPVFRAGANLASASAAGLSDIGTLLSGEGLNASNSASFKNAQRLERSRTDVNVTLNDPGSAVQSLQSTTTGKVSGLNVGVNMVGAEGV